MTNPFIHIRSDKFRILPGEEEELVNEGMYGKALCLYLKAELEQRGWSVPLVGCEDWGWWVEVQGQPFALGLCVHGRQSGSGPLDLCVTVHPEPGAKWSWGRFRFVDTTSRVEQLLAEVQGIFAGDDDVQVLGCTEDFPLE